MSAAVQTCLQDIEAQVQRVAQALSGASGDELVEVCDDLQQQIGRLHHLLQLSPLSPSAQLPRVLQARKTAAALSSLQENLARRVVLTQQTLQTLFPAAHSDTYSVRSSAHTNLYGSAGRRSGEFRVVAA